MNSKFLPFTCLTLCLAAAAPAAEKLEYAVEIDPRGFAREHIPMTADLPLPASHRGIDRLTCNIIGPDGARHDWRTQVERVETGDDVLARVHWIQPELKKGERRTYRFIISAAGDSGNETAFRFEDGDGYRELHFGEQPVYRHVHGYSAERHEATFKSFHHLHHFGGEGFITKGPGGLYSHHRGIFLGWNQVRVLEQEWDFWQSPNGETQRHRAYAPEREQTGPVFGRAASHTDWKDPDGNVIVSDLREITAWWIDENTRIVDVTLELNAVAGPVHLGGDAHHAGFQFRAAQVVADNQETSAYARPESAEARPDEIWAESPWIGGLFTVKGHRYSILLGDHPQNPRPTYFSTRKYGRFGAFFTADLEPDEPLVLRYRILVKRAGRTEDTSREFFARMHRDFVEPATATVNNSKP